MPLPDLHKFQILKFVHKFIHHQNQLLSVYYPRRARSALGVDTVLTLDVCLFVCLYVSALEIKRLIGMT